MFNINSCQRIFRLCFFIYFVFCFECFFFFVLFSSFGKVLYIFYTGTFRFKHSFYVYICELMKRSVCVRKKKRKKNKESCYCFSMCVWRVFVIPLKNCSSINFWKSLFSYNFFFPLHIQHSLQLSHPHFHISSFFVHTHTLIFPT